MSNCLALTRKWKPCSNYANLEEDEKGGIVRDFTCTMHKGFFDDPSVIKEKWFIPKEGGYAHYMHISPWTMKWIESCLSTGVINITKEDIEVLQPEQHFVRTSPKWTYFFLVCARYVEGFHYSWNLRLWDLCVMTLWFWSRRIGSVYITKKDLQTLVCVKGGLYEFYRGVELGLKEINDDEWFQFFDSCAIDEPEWFEIFIGIPIEEHKKYVKGVCCSLRYTAWILTKKKRMLDKCKERASRTSHELMAVAHHPDRSLHWTFSSEELAEITRRWKNAVFVDEPIPLSFILEEVRHALGYADADADADAEAKS